MFPTHREAIITSAVLAFSIGVLLSALASHNELMSGEDMLAALATLVAAFTGAWFAFYLNIRNSKKIERDTKIASLNGALFTLMRQNNAVAMIKKSMDTFKTDESLAFEMPAMKLNEYSGLRQNLEAVSFLTQEGSVKALLDLTIEEERFEQVLFAVQQKHEIYLRQVLPELRKAGLTDKKVSLADIKAGIPEESFKAATYGAAQARAEVDDFYVSGYRMHKQLRQAAKSLFPDATFLDYKI